MPIGKGDLSLISSKFEKLHLMPFLVYVSIMAVRTGTANPWILKLTLRLHVL